MRFHSKSDMRLSLLHVLVWWFLYDVRAETVIRDYSPQRGSGGGGTTVNIFGEFDIQPFAVSGKIENDTMVYFVGTYQEFESIPEKDSTHETQITCYTKPMPDGTYKVCPEVGGVRSCFSDKYTVSSAYTPTITELLYGNLSSSFAGPPGILITIFGKTFSAIYMPNNNNLLSSSDLSIRRVLAGPADCSLVVEGQSDVLYDLRYEPEGQTVTGMYTCKAMGTFVGNSNFSFIVSEIGRSLPSKALLRVTGKDKIYMFQTYAEILEISPKSGSIIGGTEIIITGSNFGLAADYPDNPAEINIMGHTCKTTKHTDTELRCLTPTKPQNMLQEFSGSRGVFLEKWTGQSSGDLDQLIPTLDNESSGYSSWYHDSAGYSFSETYTTVKMSGYFECPVSDTYQFLVNCDDPCHLYVGTNSSHMVKEIDYPTYSGGSYTYSTGQRSRWMDCNEGELLYYAGYVVNYGGPGNIQIAALRSTTTLTATQSDNVYNERQDFLWSASTKADIQHLSLINWTSTTSVDEEQSILVESPCFQTGFCASAFYRLSHNGLVTPPLLANALAFEVEHAVSKLMSDGVTVSVTSQPLLTNDDGDQIGMIYNVAFGGGLGDEMELSVYSSLGANVTVTEDVKGLPNFGYFSLTFLGRTTEKLPVTADSIMLEGSINELRGAKCPSDLLGDSNHINYYVVLDFEGSRPSGYQEHGWRVSTTEAFCNRYSLKRPNYVFVSSWNHFTEYRVEDYPVFCFAHKGVFKNNFVILMVYRDASNIIRSRYHYFDFTFSTDTTDWTYDCFNLENAITAEFPDFTEVVIRRIGEFRRITQEHEFYIDSFIIASEEPDLTDLMQRRLPPMKWQGKLMSSVSVHKENENATEFQVTINPSDCAHDLPLIQVFNAREVVESGEDFFLSTASNWADNVVVSVTRSQQANEPMGGHFSLTYEDMNNGSFTLQDIPAEISLVDLRKLLETIEGIGDMKVSSYGDRCYRRRFAISWESNGGNKNPLQIDTSNVVGDEDLYFTFIERVNGGVLHGPLPGELARRKYDSPQVEVKINGIQSSCTGDCSFVYSEADTPTLTEISPNTSDVIVSLTITGMNLNGSSETTVMIGGSDCEIQSESSTSIVCIPGPMEFGEHKVYVNVGGKGLARPLMFHQDPYVEDITPMQSFTTGGIPILITGQGLGHGVEVLIGGKSCTVTDYSAGTILCILPPSSSEGSFPVTLKTSIRETNHSMFTYDNAGLPVVTTVEPEKIYGSGGDNMTINGTGFGNSTDGVSVTLGDADCEVLSVSDNWMLVRTPYLPSDYYKLEVAFEDFGRADTETHSIPDIEYAFSITDFEPKQVSLFGGSMLTIDGEGFSEDDVVTLGDIPCHVESAVNHMLTCKIGSSAKTHIIENTGVHPTYGSGYQWEPRVFTITQGDTVLWTWDLVVESQEGIAVYETDGPADSQHNGGFTSGARSQSGQFAHKFSHTGTYYYNTGYIDGLAFGALYMDGTIHVQELRDLSFSVEVSSHGIDAAFNVSPSPDRFLRSTSCSPLDNPIPGCGSGSRKRRDVYLSRKERSVGTPITITQTIIDDFIDGHNAARSSVVPSGNNIILARWDNELAAQAESHATQCVRGHSSNRVHSEFSYVGENIAYFFGAIDQNILASASVDNWVNEKQYYTFNNNSCQTGEVCGHYTQVVWSNSYAIGCAISDCSSNYTIVCQYGEGGNYQNTWPYQAGSSCSDCPANFPSCDSQFNLCMEDNVPTSPTIDELTTAASDGGNMDIATTSPVTEPMTTSDTDDEDNGIDFSTCHTPVVEDISPGHGTVSDTVVIKGYGFGDDSCRLTVSIGDDIMCAVSFSNETVIMCSPSPVDGAQIATPFPVSVNVLGYGYAFINIADVLNSSFALMPSVDSVQPDTGSVEGGTLINITGSGFLPDVIVNIGTQECIMQSLSYTSIVCETPAGAAAVQPLSANVQGHDVVCDGCEFEYSLNETPEITGVDPDTVDAGNTQIHLTGSKLLPSAVVTIGDYACVMDSLSDVCINCTVEYLPAGQHEIKVYVAGKGDAQVSTSMITGAAIASLDTTVGGTAGGLVITVVGHGFLSDDLSVTVGTVSAEIIDGPSNTQFQVLTPSGNEGIKNVVITSNGVEYSSLPFEYSAANTPTVTEISPSMGDVGDHINLHGTLLDGNGTVSFGDAACNITFRNSTLITCIASQPFSGGSYHPSITIDGVGYAEHNGLDFTYARQITGFSPMEGSHGGGNLLTIQGSGFHIDSTVLVGLSECSVSNVAYNQIECEIEQTPSISTREDPVISFHANFEGQDITVFYSDPYDFHYAIAQSAENCVGCQNLLQELTTATGAMALESPMSFTVDSLGPLTLYTPESSSPSYICLGSVLAESPLSQNELDKYVCVHYMLLEESTAYLISSSASLYVWGVAGSSFVTFSTTAAPPVVYKLKDFTGPLDDISVPVNVALDGEYSLLSSDNYTFSATLTPVVTDVSPARGGTGGGTTITVTGSGFTTTTSDVHVTIDGTECEVQSATNTHIVCITGPANRSIERSVIVDIAGKGQSLGVGAQFYYIDVWSSIYTWGGLGVPGEGAFVVIPHGQVILIDQNIPTLEMLLIYGGHVIFDEMDIEINSKYIMIMEGGRLEVGTEDQPFEHKAIITLHGHVRSTEIPIYGAKCIGVREGTLDLHGQYVPVTWTVLAQTADVGVSTIVLRNPVTWKTGDEIVIASTGDKFSQNENEQHTTLSVNPDKVTITLQDPLQYKHLGEVEIMTDGTVVATQAEVGLLTRNVVVRGSRHEEWDEVIPACPDGFNPGEFAQQTCFLGRHGEERGSDQYGAQIMFHHPSKDEQKAFGRISYAELSHMGQAFRLGRYAIHFHIMGDMEYRNYIRGCSIHESFNRAVTIHDTHKAVVEKNVIYNAMGGCVFIEDGVETGNILRENLVVFCRQSTSLQNEDITPSAFWVTNPNNIVEHNAVAGGTHFGYWYRMHQHPSGPSATTTICPRNIELGSFYNNTAHSLGWFGLWIFQQYTPKVGSCCGCSDNAVTVFSSLTAWHCDKGVEFVNTGSVQIRDSLFFNNRFTGVEVKLMVSPKWGEAGVYDSVIIGHTSVSGPSERMANGVVLPYTDGWEVVNVTFINFDRTGGAVFSGTTVTGTCAENCGGFHNRAKDNSLENCPNVGKFRWEHEYYIEDLDGSLTGSNSPKVIIPFTKTAPPSCIISSAWGHGPHQGMVCPPLRLHRLAWNQVFPSSIDGSLANLTNQYGVSSAPFEKKRMTNAPGWMALLFEGLRYEWIFDSLPRLSNISYNALFSNYRPGECNIITHPLTSNPDRFRIVAGQDKNSTTSPLICGVNNHGDYYFDETTKTVEYIVTGEDAGSASLESADPTAVSQVVDPDIYRCFFEDCTPPPDPNTVPPARSRPADYDRWSDPQSWSDNMLPGEGEVATIPAGQWMVADVPSINVSILWIWGVLEFENTDEATLENRNFTVIANHIVIMGSGRFILGWEDNKFLGFADITLMGTWFSDELPLTQEITLGAKAIGVFGGLDLHGADVTTAWTYLKETATAGSNEITLDEDVDWREGSDILINPTGYNPWEAETFRIVAVRKEALTNNSILELNGTLQYNHLANDYTYGDTSFAVRAEVGLLTRNIRIQGNEYEGSDQQSLGGRIYVGQLVQAVAISSGYARLQNVEFIRMGQEGYSERSDPRFSLVYSETGTQNSVKPSYVKKCSFVRNFNTAYGAFGANSITFSDNIIHHTVGPSIRIGGSDNRITGNLVSLMINPGTYNGKTNYIWYWFGAIQTYFATSVYLSDNVVAGSERAAYWIGGEPCSSAHWGVNVARASLYGIYINKNGQGSCTTVQNFHIHHSYDFGIYYQDSSNVELQNNIITDSGVGIITLFNGPSSTAHTYQEKYGRISNVALVAVTESGICPTIDTSAGFMQSSPNARPPINVNSKTVGILAPSFMSAHNAAPKKPFPGLMQYPALGGKLIIEDCTFVNYADTSCAGVDHVVINTNSKNEDYSHPLFISNSIFVNTDHNSKVSIQRPSLGKINPSDCVDMECDGMKNFIINDMDGSFLNGTPGNIIPQAEYEWGGDLSRGLGDYNIPTTMLTNPNGNRIPVNDIAPHKGILRVNTPTTSCEYVPAWQAYECHGYTHLLFLIESLDVDSETRRLSPVALLSEGYVDLENGPQDHGWCAGYTCQRRLSTFFTTVAEGHVYEIHFTGTSPDQLRLRLPHATDDEAIVSCIFYSTSNRLDVYYDDLYVVPTNGYYQNNQLLTDAPPPDQPDLYKPNVTSPPASNYYDRYTKTICITVRGPKPIDIQISPAIFLGFNIPSVYVAEFFENAVANLALLLNVPPENIWIVNIVSESSSKRKKRELEETSVVLGIGAQPSQNSTITPRTIPRSTTEEDENGTVTIVDPGEPDYATELANELDEAAIAELQTIQDTIAATFELSGTIDELGGVPITGVTITPPSSLPSEDGTRNATVEPEPIVIVDHIGIVQEPDSKNGRAGSPLVVAAVLQFYDASGDPMVPVAPWEVSATIIMGGPSSSITAGGTESIIDGRAIFNDLTIDRGGLYMLGFTASFDGITKPEFTVNSTEFYLRPPRIPGSCTAEEGDEFFDKEYVWEKKNCSHLCTYDCDGFGEKCVDVLSCGPHAECIDDECSCDITDFDPNLPENLERTLAPEIICGSSYIQLTIDKCGTNEIGFELGKIFIFGDGPVPIFHQSRGITSEMDRLGLADHSYGCQGRVEITQDGVKYSFKIEENLNQCNPVITESESSLDYIYKIRAYKTKWLGNILRDRPIEVEFSCSYENIVEDSLPSPILPYISIISIGVESEGSFNITMSLWEDSDYTVPMESPSAIMVPEPFYVSIVANGATSIVLSVQNCSAYSSEDIATALSVVLIENGCPNTDLGVVVTQIGESNEVNFWVDSFLLTNATEVGEMSGSLYLECFVIACEHDLEPCTPECGSDVSRKKRDVDSGTIRLGPIPLGGADQPTKSQRINKRGAEGTGNVLARWVN